jgi:integral membrane protein
MKLETLLLVYRIAAWVTGVVLAVMMCVAWPLEGLGVLPHVTVGIGFTLHGWLYMAYFVITLLLAGRCRWRPLDALLVLLAGTIPFASFFAERRVTRRVREGLSPLASV